MFWLFLLGIYVAFTYVPPVEAMIVVYILFLFVRRDDDGHRDSAAD